MDRLRKRFMKLDKVCAPLPYCPIRCLCSACSTYMQDNSGTIERDEFLSLPQVSSNPLATRYLICNPDDPNSAETLRANSFPFYSSMIAIFDEDGGGDVDFQEFVSGLSAFSSKGNKEEKLKFAFKVYDIDRDGYISNGELFIVLKMMVGSNLKDMQLQQVCFPAPCSKRRGQYLLGAE